MDKKASPQKESEWEKEFKEFFGNTTDPNKFTEFLSFREVKEFIGLAIDTEVSNREKEIAEEVVKLGVDSDETNKISVDGVLSILKH